MRSVQGKTALITGASAGIGEAFARLLAAKGCHLIITARSGDKLEALAASLRKQHGVQVHVYTGDLSQKETPQRLFNAITRDGLQVDLLVNNAGFGKWAGFLDEDPETYEEMISLNITSIVRLTHLILPDMLQRGEGGIINVASIAAFQPCPYIAVYSATKSFLLHFSEALYGEYNSKGITVTALCPGNTQTGFFVKAEANTGNMKFDTPERVAKDGLNALLRRKNYKITGLGNYIQSNSSRFLPRKTIIGIVAGMFRNKVKQARAALPGQDC